MKATYAWHLLALAVSSTLIHAAQPELEARVSSWLQAWDAQGVHRTGTAGDNAGAAWLAREATALAGPVAIETFPLHRIDPVAAHIEIDGRRIDGEAFLDAPDTPRGGVYGTATDEAGDGPIALMALSPSAVYGADFHQMRRASKHRAHVIVTMGGAPGLALLNAESFRSPFGPPDSASLQCGA